jgi:hypothetical protein
MEDSRRDRRNRRIRQLKDDPDPVDPYFSTESLSSSYHHSAFIH